MVLADLLSKDDNVVYLFTCNMATPLAVLVARHYADHDERKKGGIAATQAKYAAWIQECKPGHKPFDVKAAAASNTEPTDVMVLDLIRRYYEILAESTTPAT